jgi:outer membrane cobalamin receptor
MKRHRRLNTSASLLALSVAIFAAGQAQAQSNNDNSTVDEIVVTGIRASLERSIEIKRTNSGVVDAISAEDIGKFPDTNLAESLQRITGVSIDRTNGEGSQVTVRGFGGGFNLVTLNGRTMPTANVSTVGGDQSVDFAAGTSRSFDFSNLASEGVSTLEVYKTGRAGDPVGRHRRHDQRQDPPSARRPRERPVAAASASRPSTTPAWTRSSRLRPRSRRKSRAC